MSADAWTARMRVGALLFVAVLIFFGTRSDRLRSGSLYINEILLLNRSTNVDEDKNTSAWVELYNAGTVPVDVGGYSLTNDATVPTKWTLPHRTVPPRGHLLVWCSGKDRAPAAGDPSANLHTSFELTRRGETVVLVGPGGDSVDAVSLLPQTEDRSYGREVDGIGEFRYLLTPTPASANDGVVSQAPIPSRLSFRPEGGIYFEPVDIEIAIPLPVDGYEIRYTTNFAAPDASSLLYSGPITLVPGERGSKIVRAAAFYRGERVTAIETHSYFLDGKESRIPILSVTMDEDDFKSVHLGIWERGLESEKRGYVEIVESTGRRASSSGMGLRLHGFTGRLGSFQTKKSYRMYFRDAYGSGKLRYPLTGSGAAELERVVLRAGNDDAFRSQMRATYIRDELIRERHALMDQPVSHGSFYSVFVNLEFLGVYNVVERIDGDFLTAYLGSSEAGFDVVRDEEAAEGTLDAWNQLRELVNTTDLADDANYATASQWIDVDNFTDYMILNIWAQNHDWPHKNFVAARRRTPDGKFVFFSWDAELSLGLYPPGFEADTFTRALERPGELRDFFAGLMANTGYQEFFLARLERHLSGALEPSALVARIRELEDVLEPHLGRELRERFTERHVTQWLENMEGLHSFVEGRPDALRRLVYTSPAVRVPRVLSVAPGEVVVETATPVMLSGGGFTDGLQVSINDVPVEVVRRVSASAVEVLVPADARLAGSASITVSDPETGSSTRTGILRVTLAPSAGP